jgi:hypothetical protein
MPDKKETLKLPLTSDQLDKIIAAVNYMGQTIPDPELLQFAKYLEVQKKILLEKPYKRV